MKFEGPAVLALFQKRIEGDDALLQLAALRFREAGLGTEYYAESPGELEWLLNFRPAPDTLAVVHLRRGLDLLDRPHRMQILDFAREFNGRLYGMVVHDQSEITTRPDEYLAALHDIGAGLKEMGESAPFLFIEYAVGLDPEAYIGLFRSMRDIEQVSACIDTGHLGLWQVRATYSRKHQGKDVCSLSSEDPSLPDLVEDVQEAVGSGMDTVLRVIAEIGGIGKPLHFHLHDGHPLSRMSEIGVSDHLSFYEKIPIPFEFGGRGYLNPMFGTAGLARIVKEALKVLPSGKLSFSLEIHPKAGRLFLGNAADLFSHWADKGNAERMNFWLSVLRRNREALMRVLKKTAQSVVGPETVIIYNLFPLLAGRFDEWESHLLRAADMGFTWVFVNPVQKTGKSGSIYSIEDYFSLNPLLIDEESLKLPPAQLRDVVKTAEGLGLKMMIDLVINHCSVDSPLLKTHPEWFVWERGRVSNPYAYEDGKKVVWKDLAKFDHRNTRDREGLFAFFFRVVKFLADIGFRGFRCDAAYQVPGELWQRLIGDIKRIYPDTCFFAETLGSRPEETRTTAGAGFDYIFNSSKWWDFKSSWLMQQYLLTREIAPSVSFPESHDTVRLLEEYAGNLAAVRQRYLFSALFSAGVMMPVGFEFGFRRRLHVVKTRPEQWENTGIDLTSFIAEVNRIKSGHAIFREDAPTEILPHANPNVLFMWKGSSASGEEALLILNKDVYGWQDVYADSLQAYIQSGGPLRDISPEGGLAGIASPFSYRLRPGQGLVFLTAGDE
ncbi:MAG: alpha-amylase family glycosyl hydrolase [Nitrospiraceae bacterium]|nr:alpha-amylase family glycosyl hydrolase [Nitrospiraceae bacterium]